MTADSRVDHGRAPSPDGARPVAPRLTADLFLLAGRFPPLPTPTPADARPTDSGLAALTPPEPLTRAVEYAVAAERTGLHGVWMAEHHFSRYAGCPSATLFAAHVLARTRSLRVGTATAILSTRHPVALAEEALTLDALAPGRIDLGVARGSLSVDLEVFGTGPHRYHHGFPEALELLLRWLSGAPRVDADGPTFRFRPVEVVPPARRPVPVWVGATSPPTVEVAARHGLPLLLGMHAAPAEHRVTLDRYAAVAAAHGHPADPGHASVHVAHVDDSTADARRRLRSAMPPWLATAAPERLDGTTGPSRDPVAYTEHLLDLHPVGDPDHCRRRLADAVGVTGVRRVLFMVEGSGSREATLRTIAGLASEVLPALR